MQFINPDGVHPPGPYTHIVKLEAEQVVFLAGQIAFDVDGQLVGKGDVPAQLQQCLENVETLMQSMGADRSKVVKITIYIADYQYETLPAIRQVLTDFWAGKTPPTSALIGVQRLALPDLLVEVQAIAAI